MKKYNKKIYEMVEVFDLIFNKLNLPELFHNPNIHINEISSEQHLWINFSNLENNQIHTGLHLTLGGIFLDIDNRTEVFEWEYEEVNKSNSGFISFFINYFSSYILMESYGNSAYISFFNSKGEFVEKFNLSTSILSIFDKFSNKTYRQQLFFPIMDKSISNN